MNKKKVFIACPITKYLDGNNFINEDFEYFINNITENLKKSDFTVFLALEREEFGNKRMEDDVCTYLDYQEMLSTDYLLALPEDSQGVAVEIGWASAHNKKIVLFQNTEIKNSPLINAINTVATDCEIFKLPHEMTPAEKVDFVTKSFYDSLEKFESNIDNSNSDINEVFECSIS